MNLLKSAVDRPWKRKFPGFTVSRQDKKLKVAEKAIDKLKDRVWGLTRRTRGKHIGQITAELRGALLVGKRIPAWPKYEVLSLLRDLDKRIRRKLRCYVWK